MRSPALVAATSDKIWPTVVTVGVDRPAARVPNTDGTGSSASARSECNRRPTGYKFAPLLLTHSSAEF